MRDQVFEDIMRRRDRKSEIIDDYLQSIENPSDPETSDSLLADDIADQLFIPGKPLHQTVVIIPVAAVSEQTTIGHAIDEYARQEPVEPFSLVLGLNIDVDWASDDSAVQETVKNLELARARHPNLDIRSSYIEYCDPTIGAIRRDLWNGVLKTYQADGIDDTREMVGINHDIDVVHIPKQYIAKIQKRYQDPSRSVGPAYAQTRHAWDPNHPYTSKAVLWTDFVNITTENGYEAGAVIPMSYYAEQGGFHAARRTHEVGSLTANNTPARLIRTGKLLTSPRRYVDRLPAFGHKEIWTADSFTSGDDCRSPDYVAAQPDLSRDQLNKHLLNGVMFDMRSILMSVVKSTRNDLSRARLEGENWVNTLTKTAADGILAIEFDKKIRVARRVMALCEPDNFTSYSQGMGIKMYKEDIKLSAKNLVLSRL